ncbi:LPS assembly protein LptD [Verrucomicrobiaceae bacterium R5-34]|nr:LPS assembly protein LptD [Oceaniferula flavus]MBK1831445.1 LPS assembly protein LptD [Verrucomicrobiaceae bacterium R5-34]
MRRFGSSIFLPLSFLCIAHTSHLSAQDLPAASPDADAAAGQEGEQQLGRGGDPTQPDFDAGLGGNFAGMPEMPSSIRVDNDGTLEFDLEKGTYLFLGKVIVQGDNGLVLKAGKVLVDAKAETAILTGNVSVLQKAGKNPDGTPAPGMHLFSDRVTLDAKKKVVTLLGNVSIYQGPTLHRGDRAVYNYGTRQLGTEGLASRLGPILLESDSFKLEDHNGRKAYVGQNAGITTHDVENPNFWLRSDTTTIYPGNKVIFKNLRLYAGDTSIFWLPYLSQPLDADLGYHFLPGAKTSWGLYLLNTYGIMLGGDVDEVTGERENAWLLSQWHFDIRTRRGIGTGLDLYDYRLKENENLGWLKLYYLNDWDPSLERSSEDRGFVNEDRWKLELKHRLTLREQGDSRTFLDFDVTALSDRYFLEDYEPGTYKINPNPDNDIGIFHRNPKALAGLYARLRLNDFYTTDTRLPEIFLDQVKGPLWDSPVLHEGQTSFGIYREYLADYYENELQAEADALLPGDPRLAEINSVLDDRGFSRFHTYHEFSLPLNHGGAVAIVPRAGFGHTRYWGLENDTDSFSSTHFSVGLDLSMKFSKVYPDIQNADLGIDGLLHIFQPYINFSQLSTNGMDSSFYGIDQLTPSTRPRPLEVGRFTAIDDLSDWSIMRLGMRNRLMTKRNGDTHEWLTMNTYIDVFFNDPELGRDFSNLYNEITWQPLPWMSLDLETQFPIAGGGSGFREVSSWINFMPNERMELSLGYRQLNNHPILNDSDRVDIKGYLRLSEAWGLGFYQRWEFDDGTLEVQQISVHHDFDSWTGSLGLLMRDNRDASDEYGLVLNFTLKEFPRMNLPLSVDNE